MDTITNAPISLVIDGSGGAVFAGLLDCHDQWLAKIDRSGAPLEELFPAIEQAFKDANLTLADVGSYIYCEGPGSVLGLRLCAMAIETWTLIYPQSAQLYHYNSLRLSALALIHAETEVENGLIVADWKKGAWNAVFIKHGVVGSTEVIDDAELASWTGAIYHLPQRKGWQSPPVNAQTLDYTPAIISEIRGNPSLLQLSDSVELYSSGINTFQKWTPTRHRAIAQ